MSECVRGCIAGCMREYTVVLQPDCDCFLRVVYTRGYTNVCDDSECMRG